MKLNARQQLFVLEYLKDMNGKQAAIRAGYSEKTAESQASRLLTNVKVGAAIREGQAERTERTKIDADWVLSRLAAEADADIADLYYPEGATNDQGDNIAGHLKPVYEWPKIWRQGLVQGIEPSQYGMKVKVNDRVKRLELIGKHIGVQAFKEKVEHTVDDDLATILSQGRSRVSKGEEK